MATCIDQKERFGDRYKIGRDPSYYAEYGENAWTHDPWYLILPCRMDHIYPHGDDLLAASVEGHPNIVGRMKRLPYLTLRQDGTDGATFTFDVADFAKLAKLMRPYRKRKISEAERERLTNMGRANLERFRNAHVDVETRAPESLPMG